MDQRPRRRGRCRVMPRHEGVGRPPPGPSTTAHWSSSSARPPLPGRVRSGSGSPCAGSAARTSTSPRPICRRTARCRAGPESSASSTRSATARRALRRGASWHRLAPAHLRPCRFCLRGDENLCLAAAFHGLGCRRWLCRPRRRRRALCLPAPGGSATRSAPLLCAGIIGYRALRRAALPRAGDSGSTASVRPPTSPPRSRWPRARPCT